MNLLRKIFFVLILFASTNAFAQLPPNIGFENGNFSGWETSIGYRDYTSGVITMDPVGAPSSRHIIINDKNSTDPYGGFPVLCPNGSKYSIKLGDDNSKTNPPGSPKAGRVQVISRTLNNVPANFSLIFNYAVVLEDNRNASNSHPAHIQPKFEMRVVDLSNNTVLTCPYFDFTASSTLPGFLTSGMKRDPQSEVIYKDWSTAFINLNNYAGKNVKIEFTTTDCAPGLHFGYAYIDIDEKLSLNPISGNVFCNNQTMTTLIGPTGFADYTWYKNGDLTHPVSGQSIPVTADDGVEYELHITPYLGLGCPEILHITLKEFDEPFFLNVLHEVYGCPGTGVDLTSPAVRSGGSTMIYSYYKDEFGLVYLPNPEKVTQPGEYFIRGTNGGGCTDIQKVKVILVDPVLKIINPIPVRYPTKVDLSLTHDNPTGVTHRYFSDAAGTIEIDKDVNATGTYYIKATSGIPCSVIVPVKVVVNPPPPYTIEAPNTFTPNGDGVNDFFKIKIDGFVSLTQLTIFNRYGQKVFATRSINDYWTGTSSGSALPNGTYYWIFEGTDDYFHTKVKQASSITIVR